MLRCRGGAGGVGYLYCLDISKHNIRCRRCMHTSAMQAMAMDVGAMSMGVEAATMMVQAACGEGASSSGATSNNIGDQ